MDDQPSPERVSIRDLARIAGVSRTTVSLALRGSDEVSEETRKRIQALAKKHDYRSHPAVNALMQQVGRRRKVHDEEVIAFIRSGSIPEENAPGPLEILDGATQEAHRLGFKIEIFWAGPAGRHSGRLARVLYQRGIRGVIWAPMPHPHPPLVFPWERFVPVACTLSTDVHRLPAVHINHPGGMETVLAELRRRGVKGNIGVILLRSMEGRQNFGWSLGIDLHRHRSGDKHVQPLLVSSPQLDREATLSWIEKKRIEVLVIVPEFERENPWLSKVLPFASLDIARTELGQIAGLYQDMRHIGRLVMGSLAARLYNDVPGLPDQALHTVADAVFSNGKSLRHFAQDQTPPPIP